jgi:hypothetical protein
VKDEAGPDAGDRIDVKAQGSGNLVIVIAPGGVLLIAHQQYAGVCNLLGGCGAVACDRLQTLTGFEGEHNEMLAVRTIHG